MNYTGLLPPRTVAKIRRLPKVDRKVYAQELKGSYEYRRAHLKNTARDMARDWVDAQAAHLDRVIVELDAIINS